MKKLTLLFSMLFILSSFVTALGFDQTGKFAIGAYGGYGVGFGDKFKKWEFEHGSSQNKLSFSFGAKAKYGFCKHVAFVGAVDYQAGKWEGEDIYEYPYEYPEYKVTSSQDEVCPESENWNWIGILGNVMYSISPEKKTSPYVTAGAGFYMPDEGDSKPGINLGAGVEHFFQPALALDAGARFHYIFLESEEEGEDVASWDNITYVQIYFGIIYYFGVE
jgi:hypothetical protein